MTFNFILMFIVLVLVYSKFKVPTLYLKKIPVDYLLVYCNLFHSVDIVGIANLFHLYICLVAYYL